MSKTIDDSDHKRRQGIVLPSGKGSKLYACWISMRSRCNSPTSQAFRDYGGRGIRVCSRWDSFANFREDVGEPPSKKHSIERIDVNGDYAPGNVRWATAKEQVLNRRSTVFVVVDGKRVCLKEACAMRGLKYSTVHTRMRVHGFSVEEALSTPISSARTMDRGRGGQVLPILRSASANNPANS